ncbi:MAG: hypothetical protein ACI8P9_002207 [Parasphingorhabdus sp.]|jgi:hypothetical protein
MIEISLLYAVLLLTASLLGVIAVWSRRRLLVRLAATGVFIAIAAVGMYALLDLLSRPKPSALEMSSKDVEEALVLAVNVDEGKAIYVWLRLPAQREPRAYAFPWSLEMASELKKAIKQAADDRTSLHMRQPFDPSNEIRQAPRFYSLPPERLPLKPQPETYEYKHPSISV